MTLFGRIYIQFELNLILFGSKGRRSESKEKLVNIHLVHSYRIATEYMYHDIQYT